MFKNMLAGSIIAVSIIISVGCAIQVGDSLMGAKSEGFFYTDGILRTNYHTDFERVWDASIKALKQLNIQSITEDKKISKGTVTAMTYDEEIRLTVEYLERNITQVVFESAFREALFRPRSFMIKSRTFFLVKNSRRQRFITE